MNTLQGELIRVGTMEICGEKVISYVIQTTEGEIRFARSLPMYRRVSIVESSALSALEAVVLQLRNDRDCEKRLRKDSDDLATDWRVLAERLGAIVAADASQHDFTNDIEPALAELARMKVGRK